MTVQRIDDGDNSLPLPSSSLRERALEVYQEISEGTPNNDLQFSTEAGLSAIHELHVHQIELEMQNHELRQTQLALEESRQRYLDLYDRAPVGYCIVCDGGLIQEANRTFAEMLGTTPSCLLLKLFSKFICEKDQDEFYFLRRRCIASSEPQTCEVRVLKSDSTLGWVQLSVSHASGPIAATSLRVVVLDVDARIRAETAKTSLESQLRESQKLEALGTLAGGIAHDFNNILAVIFSNTELARVHTSQSDFSMHHCVEAIQKASERGRDLVKQLLAFCRRQPTDRKSISLAPVIEEHIRFLRSTLPARILLLFTSAEHVPNIFADSTQIGQVLINLATNAAQAIKSTSGTIKIHLDTVTSTTEAGVAESDTKVIRLTFSDDGPGIEEAVIDRVFDPFFTTKPVDEGTGLGLAVVHGIIHAHGGKITVKSQLGHGTTFTICFPPASSNETELGLQRVVAPFELENISAIANPVSPVAPTCRILFIDDDETVIRSIVNLLGYYGFQVRGYSDPLTALAALRASVNNFDVVVTDYNMPSLSGLDVSRQVREIRLDLPVIVASGFIDEVLRAHAGEAGVKALISKPFSAKTFCDLVKQLLHEQVD